jgi:hypothetical protein
MNFTPLFQHARPTVSRADFGLMAPLETKSPSDMLLGTLRAKRWHATGGQGTPPDLTCLRDDCLEEIVAEFYEGEPGALQNGKSLVSFGYTCLRVFFVSELFTEYDLVARSWKTFHISRRGTDELSLAPCREDGSALDGYEQRTFRDLEKRSIVDYIGTSAKSRIQIFFQPPPLGEEALYALIADGPGPEATQVELGLLDSRKPRRRGRRVLKPERLDIPMFIKQGQHLTNQILGRPTVSAKPVILEQLPAFKLPGEINEQVVQQNIRAIGADLNSAEHQALNAILKLLTLHGYRDKTIRLFPEHWYDTYGVVKHDHSKRGTPQFAQRHKLQAMQALASLAAQPMLISYKRRNENERWDVVQRITNLIKVSSGYLDVDDKQADRLMNGILLDAIDNLRVIEIECDELFFDQVHQHYFKRPRDLDQRLKLTNNHKRLPDSIYNFLNYIYSDGEMRRRKNGHNSETDWRLIISLTDLAYLLRMKDKIKHGERGRVSKEIDKIAGLVKAMGILRSYDLSEEDALVFELNGQEAFPTAADEADPEDGGRSFGLVSGVKAILENPQHAVVRTVIDNLLPAELGASPQEQKAIARAIKNAASRLFNLHIIVPENNFRIFLSEVTAKVRERKGIKAIDRYFATTLEDRLLAALDDFSQESKRLEHAAETNPKAAAKLMHAEEFLRSLTIDKITS